MTQVKITFDQIRKGDTLEVVWMEDSFIEKRFGVADKLFGSGTAKTWRDADSHAIADNWSKNQDRIAIWLTPNPTFKIGNLVDVVVGFGLTPSIAKVTEYKGRNTQGKDVYSVSLNRYSNYTVVEDEIKGSHVPPFKQGDKVQTRSSKRPGTVQGTANTLGYLRVEWDKGGENSLGYDDIEAYTPPVPKPKNEIHNEPGDRVRTPYGEVGTVDREHLSPNLVVVRLDHNGGEVVERREELVTLYAPRARTLTLDEEVELDIIEKSRELYKGIIEGAHEELGKLKDRKREILSK